MLRMVSVPRSIRNLALFSTLNNQVTHQANAFEPAQAKKMTSTTSTTATGANLEKARNLQLPTYQEMLRRDAKVYDFWNHNEATLEKAWKEWNAHDEKALALPKLDASIINPKLRQAVEATWKDPSPENEQAIKDL